MRRPPVTYHDGPYHDLLVGDTAPRARRGLIHAGARVVPAGELASAARRMAAGLVAAGVRPGERVAVQLPIGVEALTVFLGVALAGAAVVPISPAHREHEVAHVLADAGAVAVITGERQWPVVRAVWEATPDVRLAVVAGNESDVARPGPGREIVALETLARTPAAGQLPGIARESLALLPYSSGTTGPPKGVMLTHRNLVATLTQFGAALDVTSRDVLVTYLPLSHIYGLMVCGIALAAGATLVLLERYDLERVLDAVTRHRATLLFAVPPVVAALSELVDAARHDLSSLRLINTGAAPQAPVVIRQAAERTGVPVITGYGLTEAAPASHSPLPPRGVSRAEAARWSATRPGGVGYPVNDTDVRIVDPASGRTLSAGSPGELWLRGPQVMQGYWNQAATTASILQGAWLRTGDLATRDSDSYLTIVGRLKELIKVKGFSVAPAEVESVLLQHPAVADCAVVGRADAEHGEVPVAFVVLRPGVEATAAELVALTGERLATYKRLRDVRFVPELPRSPAGKVLRPILAALDRTRSAP
jgi:acyl-CoA synthetase (AMP-forming)/AMP-acid ligase II